MKIKPGYSIIVGASSDGLKASYQKGDSLFLVLKSVSWNFSFMTYQESSDPKLYAFIHCYFKRTLHFFKLKKIKTFSL